ncbi:MAG: nucleotidyltransferase domain-containing protein [Candidatus Jordarchaeales archaeon]
MPPLEGRRLPMEVEEWLRELVRSLREVEPDVEVYLTGSYARGDWPDDSDVGPHSCLKDVREPRLRGALQGGQEACEARLLPRPNTTNSAGIPEEEGE